MVSGQIPFLILATSVALVSLRLNYAFTKIRFSADRAFWYAWLFLIWSAEFVTTVPYFAEYNQYKITPEIRSLTVATFFAAGVGFLIGSAIYGRARSYSFSLSHESAIVEFAGRWQNLITALIFLVGFVEFVSNWSRFTDLLDLRLAAVSGDVTTATVSTQFFYFAQAFVLLVGFADGYKGKISLAAVIMSVGGLILHNLAVGGRINIVVAPLLYLISFAISANQRPHWPTSSRFKFKRLVFNSSIVIIFLFSFIRVLRTSYSNTETDIDPVGLFLNALFAIPMYVSDTFISVSIHSTYALKSGTPFGYFTFDAFYRLFEPVLSFSIQDQNEVFGHAYYRDSSAVWAWTQTNMIPRLIADFGSLFWLALIGICAISQWLSLYRIKLSFFGSAVHSIMIFSSAYSILNVFWFSAFNVYILFYSAVIYLLATARRSS